MNQNLRLSRYRRPRSYSCCAPSPKLPRTTGVSKICREKCSCPRSRSTPRVTMVPDARPVTASAGYNKSQCLESQRVRFRGHRCPFSRYFFPHIHAFVRFTFPEPAFVSASTNEIRCTLRGRLQPSCGAFAAICRVSSGGSRPC